MSGLSVVSRGNRFRNLYNFIKCTVSWKDSKRGNYYVLIPEIPPDTPENNPLLRNEDLPQFSNITAEKCVNAIGKYVIEMETSICRLEEKLTDGSLEKTFETVVEPLEKLEQPLNYSWGVLRCLSLVKQDTPDYRRTFIKLYASVRRATSKKYKSLPIYHSFKEINADENKLTGFQNRAVKKLLLESRLNGIDLSTTTLEKYNILLNKLAKEQATYREKLEYSSSKFKHVISHENLMRKFPQDLVSRMAIDRTRPSEGPWNVTLDPQIYFPFLEHCSDRMLRWNVWRAYNTRASYLENESYNSLQIEEIRSVRRDMAQLLGFNTYADMSMETKMLGSVEKTQTVISTLHTKLKPDIQKQLLQLQEFALQKGFDGQLELWDVPYWCRQHKEFLYSVDKFEVCQYFPLETVLKGLFEFCRRLLSISVEEMEVSDEFKCHPDVRVYRIIDEKNEVIAKFYLDPFSRPRQKLPGTHVDALRYRSEVTKSEPLSYLTLNISPAVLGKSPLLTFKNVCDLFMKFGEVLQHSLTKSPYSSISGTNNMEWDVVDMVPQFMTHWLHHYETARDISGHVETGEKLPLELHQKLVKRQKHMAVFNLTSELYRSALDLELYTHQEFWDEIVKRVWAEYMPFPLEKNDSHSCSFSEIFAGHYAAAYFSFTWAKVVAADVFSTFREAGLDNEEQFKELGKRFRDTFLASGGGCDPNEVFRKFRGRDPSVDALLVTHGLKKLSAAKSAPN